LIVANTLSFLVQKVEILFIKLIAGTVFTLAANDLQLTDSFCFSQKFWLGAVI